mmetsp:Transcript_25157/g.60038  ORF Transcript_25157/g.60038 Transcript_25157/m.60038 type:complete len:365 (+) Transcript_25157:160-1254(+)
MSESLIIPGKPERTLKHVFTPKMGGPPEFRYCQGEWTKSVESVVIDDLPFAEGALRSCYRMQIVGKDGSRENVVAKVSKDENEDKMTYYRDVQAQACAKQWAIEYNAQSTPKKVDFIEAFVMELVDRPGRPLIGMEQFVEGVFEKHNNNVGGTVSDRESERATPNAFSHFTWHASNNTILVCDIQGVMDDYTDPQIHTLSGKGFGKGNLGQAGLNAFCQRHVCNDICRLLALPQLGPPGTRRNASSEDLRVMTPAQGGEAEEREEALKQIRNYQSEPTFPRMANLSDEEVENARTANLSDEEEENAPPPLSIAPTSRRQMPARAQKPEGLRDPSSQEEYAAPAPELDHHDDALMDAILDELEAL